MPWTPNDAEGHCKAAKSDKQKRGWAEAANSAREKALKDGKSEEEADAIGVKVGNAAVEKIKEEASSDQPAATERFQEYASSAGQELRVNRVKNVVYGVKVLGWESKNDGGKRRYSPEAGAKAAHLYEKAPVFFGHSKKGEGHSYYDRNGHLENVQVREDGLYADHSYNPKHPAIEQYLHDAEFSPQDVAMSHDVVGRAVRRGGQVLVEEIVGVDSVDIVAKGGSVKSLYEEEESLIADDPALKALAESSLAAMDNARSIIFTERMPVEEKRVRLREALAEWRVALREGEIGDALAADKPRHEMRRMRSAAEQMLDQAQWDDQKYPTHDDKRKRHLAVLADWSKELKSLDCGESLKEESTMAVDYKEITLEQLREERADLVAILTGTDEHTKLTAEVARLTEEAKAKDAEIVKLTEEKDALAAKEADAAKRLAIQEELKAAKFPTDNATAYSERFQEQLFSAPDAGARKAYIEDRMALLATAANTKRVGSPAPMAPIGGGTKQPNALRERFKL